MDARAEAEKRWPIDPKASQFWADINRDQQAIFLAGAVYALREFGDMLEKEAQRFTDVQAKVAFMSWWAEAHHIADGIESDES